MTPAYDAAGNLSTVTREGKTTAYSYDSLGRPVRRSDPDGTEERYEYDSRGNLLSIIQTAEGQERIRHQYRYDNVGNRISETGEGGEWEYQYDGLDRLSSGTDVSGGQNYTFRYDAAGNMIQSSHGRETTAYQVNQAGQVTEAVVTSPDGNITKTAYRYDGRGNRVEESGPAGTVKYSYDEAGYFSGAAKTVNRRYQYNSLGVLVSRGDEWLVEDYASSPGRVLEIQGSEDLTRRFIYGNGRIGLEAEKGEIKGFWSLYADALGSTEEARELSGGRSGSSTYDPWGNVSGTTRVEFAGMDLDVTTGYTGYLYDEVLGINYANARMYDNGTGRFLSRDPKPGTMTDPLSRNAYLYARANPFRYTDPTGMSFISKVNAAASQVARAGRQLYRDVADLGHRVEQTWNRVMGDKVSYYPVQRCGVIRYEPVTQRGMGSRIKQGLGGAMMVIGGAEYVLAGGGMIIASEGFGTFLGGGMVLSGISSIGYGAAELIEAFTDYNPVRSGIMSGNTKLYYGGMEATNIAMVGLGIANAGYKIYGNYGGAMKGKAGSFLADETGGGFGKGGSGTKETVTYRRVQGGQGTQSSQPRVIIDSDGNVYINRTDKNLNISIDGGEHSQHFLNNRPGADIYEFEVPKWFDDMVQEYTIPQAGYKNNPLNQGGSAPKLTDPTTPGKSIEFPPPWIEWIEEYATNGRIIGGGQ